MYLVSTAKTTILTDFKNLQNKSIYYHANGENRDFQAFTAQQCLFVEVNQKSGLEILRIKEANHQNCTIQRVRKLTIEGVYCVACPKQSWEEVAVGLANGQVKLFNYKHVELVHKFSSDTRDNSVLFLDYNALDEYIAGVFENGSINIYGYKTKKKLEKIIIDNQSTLARFHPCKRFHLSIASYKGTVTVYDIQAKCKIYNATEVHTAPCRDLCMTPAKPDILISAGYDCLINIYDTRRKVQPTQLKFCHPLSTVAVSDCGQYFCVGNLKGELTTYDMRNLNGYLMTKKIHESAVTRVAFVPNANSHVSDGSNTIQCSETQTTTANLLSESFHAIPTSTSSGNSRHSSISKDGNLRVSFSNRNEGDYANIKHRDSFGDFLDFHSSRGQENCSPRFTPNRDSFDWEALNRKPIKDINNSETITASVAEIIRKIPVSPDHHDVTDSKLINLSTMNESNAVQPLKDRSNLSTNTNLAQIKEIKQEEAEQEEQYKRNTYQSSKDKVGIESNRQSISDNKAISKRDSPEQQSQKYQHIIIEPTNQNQNILQPFECTNSTPTIHYQQNGAGKSMKFQRLSETLSPTAPLLSPPTSSSVCCKPQSSSTTNNSTESETIDRNIEQHLNLHQENTVILNAIQSLRDEMLERFRMLEFELKFQVDRNKWELFTQNFNLWQQQNEHSEQIQQACNILAQCDPFVNEFMRLKEENELLKEQLKKGSTK